MSYFCTVDFVFPLVPIVDLTFLLFFFKAHTHTVCVFAVCIAALYNLLFCDLCLGHSSRVECKCTCSLGENMEEGVEAWKLVVQVFGRSLIPLAAQWQPGFDLSLSRFKEMQKYMPLFWMPKNTPPPPKKILMYFHFICVQLLKKTLEAWMIYRDLSAAASQLIRPVNDLSDCKG